MVHRIKLGELLVRAGVLDEARLKVALAEQERLGGRLGAVLVSRGFLPEDLLVKALSKQLAVPIAQLDRLDVPGHVITQLDIDFVRVHGVCPVQLIAERRTLLVAMADPINVNAIDEISRRTGLRVEPQVAGERAILRAIATLYGEEVPAAEVEPVGQPAPASDEPIAVPGPSDPLISALELAQHRQRKAIRTMIELLIEKGLISRDEYQARLGRGPGT